MRSDRVQQQQQHFSFSFIQRFCLTFICLFPQLSGCLMFLGSSYFLVSSAFLGTHLDSLGTQLSKFAFLLGLYFGFSILI